MLRRLRKVAPPLAVALGPVVIIVAVLRNWHGWTLAPFWLDDLGAGLLLLAAGLYAFNDQGSLRGRLLTGAFALALGVLWGSLFERTAGLHPLPSGWSLYPPVSRMMNIIALVFVGIGLLASLPSARPPFVGTRPEPEKKKGRR